MLYEHILPPNTEISCIHSDKATDAVKEYYDEACQNEQVATVTVASGRIYVSCFLASNFWVYQPPRMSPQNAHSSEGYGSSLNTWILGRHQSTKQMTSQSGFPVFAGHTIVNNRNKQWPTHRPHHLFVAVLNSPMLGWVGIRTSNLAQLHYWNRQSHTFWTA